MSEFSEYKNRRAFAEGWPHYQVAKDGEQVHTAESTPVDKPDPLDKYPLVSARYLEYWKRRK